MTLPVSDIQSVLNRAVQQANAATERGRLADYIPELAKADLATCGAAIALASGETLSAGDSETTASIQSVSKIFTLALALGKTGESLWNRVGREPSGSSFDSIVQLEHERGIPRNPFINAGALVVTDAILSGHQPKETLGEVLRFVQYLADDDTISIDNKVAASENETGHRNRALANFLKSFDNLKNPVELTLGTYFHQCAISMNCVQLANAARFLAFDGALKIGGPRVISARQVRRINAVMLTCGHYNGSGEFAFRVGVPGKSGVSGFILAIVPGVASIAVLSPGLDTNGNSLLGRDLLETLLQDLGWSIFR